MTPFRLLVFLFLFSAGKIFAQDSAYSADRAFADHLLKNQLHRDAALQLGNMNDRYTLSPAQHDSLEFQLGESLERTGRKDAAARAFHAVSPGSVFFTRAVCSNALVQLQQENYAELESVFNNVSAGDSALAGIRSYGLLAAALLQDDTAQFRKLVQDNSSAGILYREENGEFKRLMEQEQRLRSIKKKSPFVAGALSAIVPGLGKVYAGKPRHGLAAFTPVAVLGVQAFEAYRKGGIKDARFIGYASLFSVFYLGNIYGSALTVRVQRRETINDVHYVVQADLSFALQRLRR
ncbi:MAG: hypothetical protein FD123_2118 [Bacteroidetes bacterium]|nr:MAG: hypothetical protein FD123_2118 [Bacteroidota bacterium]